MLNNNGNNELTDKAKDKDKDKDKSKDISYENKYYDKFQEMESEELDEEDVKSLTNSVLFEMTPKGRIIMYYNFEKETFIYHCDTKDVPYLYLETVARKYALTYHCKKIVVDIKKELELAREASVVNEKNAKMLVGVKATDNLFASFKITIVKVLVEVKLLTGNLFCAKTQTDILMAERSMNFRF